MAAADSLLIRVIGPTDEESIAVNADDDSLPPTVQIILLIKARCENQRTVFQLSPEIGGNCRRCVSQIWR